MAAFRDRLMAGSLIRRCVGALAKTVLRSSPVTVHFFVRVLRTWHGRRFCWSEKWACEGAVVVRSTCVRLGLLLSNLLPGDKCSDG